MNIICNKTDFFKNPNKLPLDQLYLDYKFLTRTAKDDASVDETVEVINKSRDLDKWQNRYQIKVEKRPALNKCWLQDEKRYVKFQPFYPQFDDKDNEEFLGKNREFLEILNHLVGCSYHQFWCYIVCEPRVSFIITHFLEHSVSVYAASYLNDEFSALYDEIYSCIYSICERLLKFNLSETEYMSEDVAIGFLRKNDLLSCRSILLLCFLYKQTRPQLITRLIDFYFCDKYRETYTEELNEMLTGILQDFDKLDALELLSLNSASVLRRKPEKFDPTWLEDVSSYILEMTGALHQFLSVCKPAVEIAFELDMPQGLSHTYQKIYTQLYDMLVNEGEVSYDWSRYKLLITRWLALGRSEFVNLFHVFACHLLDKILALKDDHTELDLRVEMYLGLISAALDDDLFIRDYNKAHPVELQFRGLIDNVPDFDKTQTDYLLKSFRSMIDESEADNDDDDELQRPEDQKSPAKQKNKFAIQPKNDQSTKDPFPQDLYESIYDTLTQYSEVRSDESTPGTSSSKSDAKNLPEPVLVALSQYVELIKQWKANPECWNLDSDPSWEDFEPNSQDKLSDEEIQQRIKAVLEMLPDLEPAFVVKCLERMDYRPELVISRVLDNDLPGDLVDKSCDMPGSSREKLAPKVIAYVGKKPDYSDAKDLLDDKTADLKNLVLKASYAYDVDDDYDDRNEVSFENGDESKIYRHLKPDAREYNVISDPSSGSDDDESKPSERPRDPNAFCEDPAVVRARRAAQRGRNFRPPARDVEGRPKGQGQDKNVLQNREKKNVNKSSRANHHRKGGAQFKRSRGMIPS